MSGNTTAVGALNERVNDIVRAFVALHRGNITRDERQVVAMHIDGITVTGGVLGSRASFVKNLDLAERSGFVYVDGASRRAFLHDYDTHDTDNRVFAVCFYAHARADIQDFTGVIFTKLVTFE